MKKIVFMFIGALSLIALYAENKLYFHQINGGLVSTLVSKIDSITFTSDGTELNLYKTDSPVSKIITSSVDSIKVVDEVVPAYYPPTYSDDYSSISSYSNRTLWNLANVHDPTIVKCGAYYYMYGTDASYGNVLNGYGHFPCKRSLNLVSWEYRGLAMNQVPPTWVKDSLNAMRSRQGLTPITSPTYGYWAPCIRKVDNVYRMYYCIVVDNFIGNGKPNNSTNFDNTWTERAFIGLMESTDLATNSWVDKGYVISSVSDKTTGTPPWYRSSYTGDWNAYFKWNAIDPTYVVTPEGSHWLIYGSWHSGIPEVELDPTTGKPKKLNTLADYGTRIARRVANDANRWQAQEGPEIIYNPKTGYYYLFLAYDELSVNYNTRVCRSRSVTGPFVGYNGANISSGAECFPILTHPYKFNNHSGWVGFSHCCVFQNPDTEEWFYCSQARLPANTNGNAYSNAIMMGHVRKIMWTADGWPVVSPERYGNVPQLPIAENDLVGTWEHITLNYVAGVQQTSSTLTLSQNHTAIGAITGVWSYNSITSTLTIGSLALKVQRELNWESSPRVPTLVYAGINPLGRSLWGKKTN